VIATGQTSQGKKLHFKLKNYSIMARQILNGKAVQGIMNKRSLVTIGQKGKRIALIIQGNGTIVDVKNAKGELVMQAGNEDVVLQKLIFNCKANSQVAMQNARNRQMLKDAIAAEKAGDSELADKLYNDYLNKVQFSASLLLPNTLRDRIMHGAEVVGIVEEITTEKGSILTFEAGSLAIQEPERVGKTTFSLDDAFAADTDDDEDDDVEPTPVPANETAKQKKQRIAGDLARGVRPDLIVGHVVTSEA
jgi:hypothetical protein